MRLHFKETPWDLYASIWYVAIIGGVSIAFGVETVLAIPLVLFTPGYLLVAVVFPSGDKIDWTERIALSLGVNVALVSLLGLSLAFSPWGIQPKSSILTLTGAAGLLGGLSLVRRFEVPASDRLGATVVFTRPEWRHYTGIEKGLTLGLVSVLVVALGALGYAVLAPKPGERFTEFYVLGSNGNASEYPTALNVNETATVVLGITNHEGSSVSYSIRIDLVGVSLNYNATSGMNDTVEANRTTWPWVSMTLENGQDWETDYTFSISQPGHWLVEFQLYRNGLPAKQNLRLSLQVG